MTLRGLIRPTAAAVAAAGAVCAALVLALLPQPAPAGCGTEKFFRAERNVNPGGAEPLTVGDSVMSLALPRLAAVGYNANAQGCRSFAEGLRVVRRQKARKGLPRLVVLALGTDGRVTARGIDQALGVLGRGKVLGLVTPRELGGGAKFDAAVMRRAARQHPRQIVLLDWVRYSAGHGGWFQPDHVHLSNRGARVFAQFLGRAVRFSRAGRFPNGTSFP